MNIKKRLALSTAAAVLGLSLIGGGTYAYFNDVEETNNAFAAGTLDLKLLSTDNSEYVDLSVDNMKPGDWKIKQIRLINEGSLDFKNVKLNVDYTITDAKNDNGSEDFADHIVVNIMDTATNTNIISWKPLSEIDDLVLAENLQAGKRKTLRIDYRFKDNGQDQNIFQGDKLDFQLIFEASQKDGELR